MQKVFCVSGNAIFITFRTITLCIISLYLLCIVFHCILISFVSLETTSCYVVVHQLKTKKKEIWVYVRPLIVEFKFRNQGNKNLTKY